MREDAGTYLVSLRRTNAAASPTLVVIAPVLVSKNCTRAGKDLIGEARKSNDSLAWKIQNVVKC